MALITPQEVKENTSMGGNVDVNKFKHLLNDVEVLVLEPTLGTALYDRIVSDFEENSLAGDYLTMFNDYIKPLLWHSVYAHFLRDGIVLVRNTGIYENAPENGSIADIENIKYLSKNASSKADVYINRLERFLCDVNVPEYRNNQENDYDIDPQDVNTVSGWYFGRDHDTEKYRKYIDKRGSSDNLM